MTMRDPIYICIFAILYLQTTSCYDFKDFEMPFSDLLRDCKGIFILNMDSQLIKDVVLNLQSTQIVSVGNFADEKSDFSRLAYQVDCAVAKDTQANVYLNTGNTGTSSEISSILPIMTIARNPQYHFIHVNINENFVAARLSCLGFQMPLNMFNSRKKQWVSPIAMDNLNLQKRCNNGNHPLHGKIVSASAYSYRPYSFIGNNTVLGGSSVDLFKAVAKHYKFNTKLIATSNLFYQNPNGTFGGALAEALYGKVDLAIEISYNIGSRFGTLSFSDHSQNYIFIELKPKEKPRFLNIAYTFDKTTWLLSAVSFVALTLSLWLAVDQKTWTTYGSCFQVSYGIIFQEFHENNSKRKTVYKFARILWVLAIMFLAMAFLAKLKSSLMKKQFEKRTMTMNEMVDKDMRIAATPSFVAYLESIVQRSGGLNGRFLCQIKKHDSILDTNENIELIDFEESFRQQPGTKITEENTFQLQKASVIKKGREFPFVAIPDVFSGTHFAFFFRKFDPRVEYFNIAIRSLTETGVSRQLIRRWMPSQTGIDDEVTASEEPLVMEHFLIPFVFCMFGLGIGILAFCREKNHFDEEQF